MPMKNAFLVEIIRANSMNFSHKDRSSFSFSYILINEAIL